MWQELVKDEIWYTENFINEDLVDQTLEKIYSSETKELDANEQKHIISKSHYNYNHVKYDIHKDKEVVLAVIGKLNEILTKVYKPITEVNEKNVLQFTTKTFNSDSVYNVHTERKDIYGDFVFINYLTTEDGGELVFPNEYMLEDHFQTNPSERKNWQEFKTKLYADSKQEPYLVGPLAIKPKRNTCVLMRVGSAHYVYPVRNGKPGCRVVITGWPFANMDWKAKFNQ